MIEPYASGMLDAGESNQNYWETRGKPLVLLHAVPARVTPRPCATAATRTSITSSRLDSRSSSSPNSHLTTRKEHHRQPDPGSPPMLSWRPHQSTRKQPNPQLIKPTRQPRKDRLHALGARRHSSCPPDEPFRKHLDDHIAALLIYLYILRYFFARNISTRYFANDVIRRVGHIHHWTFNPHELVWRLYVLYNERKVTRGGDQTCLRGTSWGPDSDSSSGLVVVPDWHRNRSSIFSTDGENTHVRFGQILLLFFNRMHNILISLSGAVTPTATCWSPGPHSLRRPAPLAQSKQAYAGSRTPATRPGQFE